LDEIVGVHTILSSNKRDKPLTIVSKSGQLMNLDFLKAKKQGDKIMNLKGNHVHKTYTRGNMLCAISKGTVLQLWDLS